MVKELQKGHGEWVEVMKDILGKTGTIIKIYSDNDLRINFGNSVWTMNPLSVLVVPCDRFETNNSMYANANRREETMSKYISDSGVGSRTRSLGCTVTFEILKVKTQ
jgi:hypothetical protein